MMNIVCLSDAYAKMYAVDSLINVLNLYFDSVNVAFVIDNLFLTDTGLVVSRD